MFSFVLLTQSTTPIIGWVAWVLGKLMALLYTICDSLFGSANIGVLIILFTIIVNLIMLPLTIKQQRSSKLMSVMQPEIKAIQDKYKGKKDQQSAARMQAETQAVYEKYGTSMTGGCVQLLIQMPILFALYQVIYHVPGYIPQVKAILEPLAISISQVQNFEAYAGFQNIVSALKMTKIDFNEVNNIIDFLYKCTPEQWLSLEVIFPELATLVRETSETLQPLNSFLGINLATAPWQGFHPSWAWIIPALAGITQWLSAKLMTTNPATTNGQEDPTQASMKTMNTMMPLMSVFFCFTLPAGIGIYWIASAVVRSVIQLFINHIYKDIDVEKLVQDNLDKVNKKRAKKGLPPKTIDKKAIAQAEKEERQRQWEEQKAQEKKEKSDKQVIDSTEYYNANAKPGSLASKANMVAMFDQREYDKRHGKKTTTNQSKSEENKVADKVENTEEKKEGENADNSNS